MTEETNPRYAKLPHDDWYDDYDWRHILDSKYGETYEGVQDFDPTKIAEVEHWYIEEGSYGPEHSAAGVFRMEDGSYVVYTGFCDTTGWGCQDDARFTFHTTKDDAIRLGLGDRERGWFGFPNPEEPPRG